MKLFKYTAILIGVLFIILGCEKDDICGEITPTTPHLILRFYDSTIPENLKTVTDLKVYTLNEDNVKVAIADSLVATKDSIALPLRTDKDITKFVLYTNFKIDNNGTFNDTSDDIISGNADTLTVNYQREDVFVSRACGFKGSFNNLSISIKNDDDNWILNHEILNTTVENETKAHVKIFH